MKKLLIQIFLIIFVLSLTSRLNAQDCYESSIVSPTPFMGNNGEIFKLYDGSIWEVKYEYEYMYEYYPTIIICPKKNIGIVDGTRLNVEYVGNSNGNTNENTNGEWKIFEETYIEGTISGAVTTGHIFKTMSGNYYEIIGFTIEIVIEIMPEVLVLKKDNQYKLVVDGFKKPILCKKI